MHYAVQADISYPHLSPTSLTPSIRVKLSPRSVSISPRSVKFIPWKRFDRKPLHPKAQVQAKVQAMCKQANALYTPKFADYHTRYKIQCKYARRINAKKPDVRARKQNVILNTLYIILKFPHRSATPIFMFCNILSEKP